MKEWSSTSGFTNVIFSKQKKNERMVWVGHKKERRKRKTERKKERKMTKKKGEKKKEEKRTAIQTGDLFENEGREILHISSTQSISQ